MKKIIAAIFVLTFLSYFNFSCDSISKNKKTVSDSLPPELKAIEEKILEDSTNASLYFQKFEYHFKNKQISDALNAIQHSVALDQKNPKYRIHLSDLYFMMNKTKASKNELEKAINIDPNNNEALLKLGELYFLVKKYDSAVYYVNQSLNLDKENPKAYFQKGMILKESGDSASAALAFQTGIEKNPNYYESFVQLGYLYSPRRNPLAIEYFKNAIKLNPKSSEAWYGLGYFQQNTNNFDAALKIYDTLLSFDKSNFFAWYNKGYIYLINKNDKEKALASFDQSAIINPNYADALYMRGLCYEQLGDKKAAAADYNAAIIALPTHDKAKDGLKRISK